MHPDDQKPEVHIRGALRVEYRIQTRSRSETTALIDSEQRFAGGKSVTVALSLAGQGVRVRLSCNPIGTDSHGRFLLSQLQNVPNLELDVEAREEVVTPYAILIRDEGSNVQTLLSPEAASTGAEEDDALLLQTLRVALADSTRDREAAEKLVAAYDAEFGGFAL